jgi:hypothetical protein
MKYVVTGINKTLNEEMQIVIKGNSEEAVKTKAETTYGMKVKSVVSKDQHKKDKNVKKISTNVTEEIKEEIFAIENYIRRDTRNIVQFG